MIIESKFAVNCYHSLQKCKKKKSCLESFTVFSRKIFRWCLTFDAVYTITSSVNGRTFSVINNSDLD